MEAKSILDHENAERILDEGWRLFQQKGYRGVTVDELCLRCGLTKPTLYYYFKDKETLFVRVLQYKLQGFHTVIEQPGRLEERLQRVAVCVLDSFQSEYSALMRDRENIRQPEHQQAIRAAFHDEMFGPLNTLMREGIERGELTETDAETLTLIFLGIINNFIGHRLDEEHTRLAARLTHYFLQGVSTHG